MYYQHVNNLTVLLISAHLLRHMDCIDIDCCSITRFILPECVMALKLLAPQWLWLAIYLFSRKPGLNKCGVPLEIDHIFTSI